MDIEFIAKRLFFAMQQASVVANALQEGIQNERKQTLRRNGESDAHYAMREAKTKVDEMVQEMLLKSIYPYVKDEMMLDAEEDTKSTKLFCAKDAPYTLILDPIDGTLPYIQQKNNFSICAGITYKYDFILAIVFFPARDQAYMYVKGIGTKVFHQASLQLFEEGEDYILPKVTNQSKRIYKNDRLDVATIHKLQKLGYEVIDDSEQGLGCPDAILACARKEAFATYCVNRNLRDILLGVILSKMQGGNAYDFCGHKILWNASGRQEEAIFSGYDLTEFFKEFNQDK